MAAWASTLADLDVEPARLAVRRLREESTFLPSHADLIAATRRAATQLAEQQAERERPTGCQRCGGDTVIFVSEQYIAEKLGGHSPSAPDYGARRAALANTVYPCPACRPVPFLRWHEGHYGPDHSCAECGALKRGGAAGNEARQSIEARRRHSPRSEGDVAPSEAF